MAYCSMLFINIIIIIIIIIVQKYIINKQRTHCIEK